MTPSFSPEYLNSLLGNSCTLELTLEDISKDLELLKKIVSEIKEKPVIDPFNYIYKWCLEQVKIIVKGRLTIKEQEFSVIIKKHHQEIENINQKMNKRTSPNQRRELDNQDLSRVIYLERKISYLTNVIKDKYEYLDIELDFDKIVNIL